LGARVLHCTRRRCHGASRGCPERHRMKVWMGTSSGTHERSCSSPMFSKEIPPTLRMGSFPRPDECANRGTEDRGTTERIWLDGGRGWVSEPRIVVLLLAAPLWLAGLLPGSAQGQCDVSTTTTTATTTTAPPTTLPSFCTSTVSLPPAGTVAFTI